MEKFAFIVHPLDIKDVSKKYKMAEKVPPKLVASALKRKRPFVFSEITGIHSVTGKEAMGWFISVPLLPSQFLELEEKFLLKRLVRACRIAEELGAGIMGLGAYSAMVGNGGQKLAQEVNIAVTTGNTYTVTTALDGTREACRLMGICLKDANLAVVGATGSIGRACAEILGSEVGSLTLVGRSRERLKAAAEHVARSVRKTPVTISTDPSRSIPKADVIITVTASIDCVIHPEDIKPGAIICDVARPRDVSQLVSQRRDDVLVIDGGVVKVPGEVQFGLNFGLAPGLALACMSETMILALEGRYENYTLGKEISVSRVLEMGELARKHGFSLSGLRGFDKAIGEEDIAAIRQRALSATT
jgi:predicted amino acid dehydrogenase